MAVVGAAYGLEGETEEDGAVGSAVGYGCAAADMLVHEGGEGVACGDEYLGAGDGVVLGVDPAGKVERGAQAADALLAPVGDAALVAGVEQLHEALGGGLCEALLADV